MKNSLKTLVAGLFLVANSPAMAEDFEKDVQASVPPWQYSGVDIPPGYMAVVTVTGGWSANPGWGRKVGAGGNPEYKAGSRCAREGANEGCLLVMLGNGEVIAFSRDDEQIKVTTPGKLHFACNDEPTQPGYGEAPVRIGPFGIGSPNQDGAGYRDNSGTLKVRISLKRLE
jgi:hypothetical protein